MFASYLAIAIIAVLIGGVITVFSRYNDLVRSQKRVQEAWSGIDVQLRRRASLMPNLMEMVKGYAEHEREVFEEVTRARGAVRQAGGAGEAANANQMVSQALLHLFAVVENYPQLRASENFLSLRADLADAEEKIAFARQFYNRNVLDYNTRIETYPDVLLARSLSFQPAEFFRTDEEGRAELRMNFVGRPAPPEQPASPPAV
jgi:LemA protein